MNLTFLKNYSLFRKIYLINLFMSTIIFFDVISYVIEGFLMVWAFYLILNKVKNNEIKKIKYYKLILMFLLSTLITTIVQIKMLKPLNTAFDIIMIFHFCICFFLLYGLHTEEMQKIKSEVFSIIHWIISITTILTFFSILVIIFKNNFFINGKLFNFEPFSYCIGMHFAEGVERLSGIYINPNMIAFCSCTCIIFAHTLFTKNMFFNLKSRQIQISLFISTIILNLTALILSDSLASFILLSVYIILMLFYHLVLKSKKFSIKVLIKNIFIFIAVGLSTVIILSLVRGTFQSMASDVINNIYSTFSTNDITSSEYENITIGRGENYNLKDGSGRRHLLKQALFIFSKNPLLGIGIGNVDDYGKIYFKNGLDFSNFHNGYVSIAVSYGIIGVTIFMIFLVLTCINLLKALKKSTEFNNTIYPNLAALIASYCVYSLFEKTMLSEINYMGVFFWIILGYTTFLASDLLKPQYKN